MGEELVIPYDCFAEEELKSVDLSRGRHYLVLARRTQNNIQIIVTKDDEGRERGFSNIWFKPANNN